MRTNSITKFLILAALSLFLTINISAQGVRSAANWETYQICDDSVSAIFPVAPTEQVRNTNLPDGSVLTMKMNTADGGKSIYLVNCFDGLPFTAEEITPAEQKAYFTRIMENYTKLMKTLIEMRGVAARVKTLPARASVLGGRRGFEQDFSIGAFQGKAKMILYGTRGVWTIVMSNGAAPLREKTAFFNSIRFEAPLPMVTGGRQ